jgi:DNA-binding MarR family transcriptional regulator
VIPSASIDVLRPTIVEIVRAGSILQREAGRLFRPFGISAAQFNLINLLAASPRGLRASELATSLVVDPSSATYLLDQLEDRAIAVRQRDPDDRRALRIVLTPSGKKLHAQLAAAYRTALTKIASSFSARELSSLLSILEKLPAAAIATVDLLEEPAPPSTSKPRAKRRRP